MIREFFKDVFNGLKAIIAFLLYKWLYYLIMLFLNNIIMDNCKITLKEFKHFNAKERLLTIYYLLHNIFLNIAMCFSAVYCFNFFRRLWLSTSVNLNINMVINVILYITIVLIFLSILFYTLYNQKIKTFSYDEKNKLARKVEYKYKHLYWKL